MANPEIKPMAVPYMKQKIDFTEFHDMYREQAISASNSEYNDALSGTVTYWLLSVGLGIWNIHCWRSGDGQVGFWWPFAFSLITAMAIAIAISVRSYLFVAGL